ncbi:MAG: transposase [Desulfobacteraceae bacterium]|nr:transposase [Desulfobacteraceae bacterium]
MHRKNIKRIITKQLKKSLPDWKKMNRKSKKELTQEIMNEVVGNYDYSQTLDIPIEELVGIEGQMPSDAIRSLPEMATYIENYYSDSLFDFDSLKKPYPEIVDQELRFIDQLLDNQIINSLIAPEGYSAPHRDIHPYQLFRMELLKIIKYPEISYRKFCSDEYFGRERKQNRRFVRLPLNTKDQIDHTELCHFRSGLRFNQLMNILVYFLHYFYKSGCLENTVIHGVDSTELPSEINYPLCTIEVKGKKIRIYSDPDCDCGKRRKKRDKSYYVIGYRLHTLTAINPSTGHSFPLVSIVGAANHHDSLFLKPLIKLAQALGIDIKLITADQAYHDSDGSVLNETGVYVVAPASEKAKLPENVLESPLRVNCNNSCEIPMKFLGATPEGHEFGCGANAGECMFGSICPKSRVIAFDKGYFQPMPISHSGSQEAIEIRKNCERPFNLMKKREGLEQTRVRTQHGVVVRSALTTIVTLLIEMAGTRRKPKKKDYGQKELFAATG